MSRDEPEEATPTVDVGDYCRRVESHLTKVNGGHLVRIVGPGFELVRRWAEAGVPLNIVLRGVERKAERHRHGRSTRPLRIEFCEEDVRQIYEEWRRAIGLPAGSRAAQGDSGGDDDGAKRRQPSLSKHFERVLGRLDRAAERLDWPDEFRDGLESCRERVAGLRESSRGSPGARPARGAAREGVARQLAELDVELVALARRFAPADLQDAIRREAEADLAAFRGRLNGEAWQRSVDLTAERLLRDRLGLPALALPA